MGISKASAQWDGTIKTGKGVMKPGHAAEIPFSLGTRFEGQAGSNPEELIGAALAGCFSMALTVALERAGATPKSVRTSANVSLDKDSGGFTITTIELTTEASVTGVDSAKFQEIADATKKGCPVSKALASVSNIKLNATLTSS
jgi:osmotically inducible protein OsmC